MAERVLLDTSAVLALVFGEPGSELVRAVLRDETALMSTVNLAEAIGKLGRRGVAAAEALHDLLSLDIEPVPFGLDVTAETGALEPLHRHQGLSLADCACIATAGWLRLPVLTADRIWATLDLGIEVRLIR